MGGGGGAKAPRFFGKHYNMGVWSCKSGMVVQKFRACSLQLPHLILKSYLHPCSLVLAYMCFLHEKNSLHTCTAAVRHFGIRHFEIRHSGIRHSGNDSCI